MIPNVDRGAMEALLIDLLPIVGSNTFVLNREKMVRVSVVHPKIILVWHHVLYNPQQKTKETTTARDAV
jgi:hypothetical protein